MGPVKGQGINVFESIMSIIIIMRVNKKGGFVVSTYEHCTNIQISRRMDLLYVLMNIVQTYKFLVV